MITDLALLSAELRARRLMPQADAPTPDDTAPDIPRPWWLAMLLGASGWLAGLFTLGFVALLFQPRGAADAALAGAVLLAAAWGLYRVDRDGAFATQLALALSIAGQCLLVYAMNEHANRLAPIAASVLAVQLVLAVAMPNAAHRSLCAFFATIAWALTVRYTLFGEPTFWHGEPELAPPLAAALGGWALAWLPLAGAIAWALQREPAWMARGAAPLLRPVLDGLVVGLAVAPLASEPLTALQLLGADGTGQGWLALWPLLSALAALGALAAGFALQSRGLIGACAVALLLHVVHAYYVLGVSLMQKAIVMAVVGVAMLVVARRLARSDGGSA